MSVRPRMGTQNRLDRTSLKELSNISFGTGGGGSIGIGGGGRYHHDGDFGRGDGRFDGGGAGGLAGGVHHKEIGGGIQYQTQCMQSMVVVELVDWVLY